MAMMSGSLRFLVCGLMLAVMPLASWAAESRLLVVREDSSVARQAAELLTQEVGVAGWQISEATVGGGFGPAQVEGKQVLVAFGARAFAAAVRQAGNRPVIAALVAQSSLEEFGTGAAERWSAILLDHPAERWINLVQAAFPGVQQVGMLVGANSQKAARLMERKMAERRIALAVEVIASAEEVVPALERLTPRMGVLLAMPDPLAHNRNTVQPLLLTTYRAGIPVVAYSESYQQAGAVLALYSTVPQIVMQVVESLQQVRDGKPLPTFQSPRYFTVGVNSAVARSLGLSLPSANDLAGRLRNLSQ
jgi:ABC-type uncharacterized transport system substrate-binding protein